MRIFNRQSKFCLFNYSCVGYENTRLRYQLKSWVDRLPEEISNLPMTGSGNDSIDEKGFLRLNCPDGYYYDLCNKTTKMAEWFLKNTESEWLIKVDDDVWLSDETIQEIVSDTKIFSGFKMIATSWASGVSGFTYKLHRDHVEEMLKIKDTSKYLNSYYEELVLAWLLNKKGIKPELINNKKIIYYPENHLGYHSVDIGIFSKNYFKDLSNFYDYFDSSAYKEPCNLFPEERLKNKKNNDKKQNTISIIKQNNKLSRNRTEMLNKAKDIARIKNGRK